MRPERDIPRTNSQGVTFLIKHHRRARVGRDNEPARFGVSTFVFSDSSGIPIPPETQSFLADSIARVTARSRSGGIVVSSPTRLDRLPGKPRESPRAGKITGWRQGGCVYRLQTDWLPALPDKRLCKHGDTTGARSIAEVTRLRFCEKTRWWEMSHRDGITTYVNYKARENAKSHGTIREDFGVFVQEIIPWRYLAALNATCFRSIDFWNCGIFLFVISDIYRQTREEDLALKN